MVCDGLATHRQRDRVLSMILKIMTGLPLLYMGVLTLPLGFVRSDKFRNHHPYDYGYEQA